jgi:hypothetical protein
MEEQERRGNGNERKEKQKIRRMHGKRKFALMYVIKLRNWAESFKNKK